MEFDQNVINSIPGKGLLQLINIEDSYIMLELGNINRQIGQ